jgi:hypothetical protein
MKLTFQVYVILMRLMMTTLHVVKTCNKCYILLTDEESEDIKSLCCLLGTILIVISTKLYINLLLK